MSSDQNLARGMRTNPFLLKSNANGIQNADVDVEVENNFDDFNSLSASYTEISLNNSTSLDLLTVTTNETGELVLTNETGEETDDTYGIDAAMEDNSSVYCVPERPNSLLPSDGGKRKVTFPFNLAGEGTVSVDNNNMTHFVAENLEYKIKIASPVSQYLRPSASTHDSTNFPSTSNSNSKQFNIRSHLTQIDSNVLNDIEIEAQYLSSSVDNLTENLCNLLHSISSITADNVDTYKNAVIKLTDSMDSNIKSMYTIMAKTEEISKAMHPAEQLAVRIRDIKRLVDMFESNL